MGSAVRVAVILGAIAVAGIAAFGNGWYWWRVNAGSIEAQIIGVVFSATAGLLKVSLPIYVGTQGLRWRQRPKLIFVAALALMFDAWSGVGYVGMIRTDAAAVRREGRAAADAARRALPPLRAELAALDHARSAGVLPALIATQEAVAGECRPGARLTDSCRELSKLRVEFANAKERERLSRAIEAAEAAAAKASPDDARPEVAPVAAALASFGLPVSPDVLGAVWSILMLVFVELLPAAVVAEMSRPRPDAPARPTPPAPARQPRPSPAAPADLLTEIAGTPADANGWHAVSLRQLGASTKTSATTASRGIRTAVASGQLEYRKAGRAVAVRIVTS